MPKRESAAGKITPARGTLSVVALVVRGGVAASPAYAFKDLALYSNNNT
jgi:hypothetical protein